MGDEHHPLAGPRRGNDLALLWSAVSNVGGEVTRVLQLPDGALSDDGGLPFALGPRSGHDRIEVSGRRNFSGGVNGSGRWSSEVEESDGAGGNGSVQMKMMNRLPFMGHRKAKSPFYCAAGPRRFPI